MKRTVQKGRRFSPLVDWSDGEASLSSSPFNVVFQTTGWRTHRMEPMTVQIIGLSSGRVWHSSGIHPVREKGCVLGPKLAKFYRPKEKSQDMTETTTYVRTWIIYPRQATELSMRESSPDEKKTKWHQISPSDIDRFLNINSGSKLTHVRRCSHSPSFCSHSRFWLTGRYVQFTHKNGPRGKSSYSLVPDSKTPIDTSAPQSQDIFGSYHRFHIDGLLGGMI